MKNLFIIAILTAFSVMASPVLASQNPLPADLVKLKEIGLSENTLSLFIAQNLSERQAPSIDPKFIAKLGKYGGDALVKNYLELDKVSLNDKNPKLSQNIIKAMINNRIPPAEIHMIISEEIAGYQASAKKALMPPSLPPSASAETDSIQKTIATLEASKLKNSAADKDIIQLAKPLNPHIMASPKLPPIPNRPSAFQDLRPGQAADPASQLPVPYSTYDIKNDRQGGDLRRLNPDGTWMGVTEKELADRHLVETSSLGHSEMAGQEVYARPSGHKVYRYFSGNPDAPQSIAKPMQETNKEHTFIKVIEKQSYN